MDSFLSRMSAAIQGAGPAAAAKLATASDRDTLIRESLLAELGELCAELLALAETAAAERPSTSAETAGEWRDATASLCACLEAIFLHGLKAPFIVWPTASSAVAVSGSAQPHDRRPQPNFWPPLLVFTHRDTIAQIHGNQQLRSDIGYARAWLRLALNDGLLAAHLAAIRTNRPQRTLRPYYRAEAFLRDEQRLLVAERLVAGASGALCGVLATNSSLLDRWPDRPLQLAGLYAPAQRAQPVFAGFDVASSIRDDDNNVDDDEPATEALEGTASPALSASASASAIEIASEWQPPTGQQPASSSASAPISMPRPIGSGHTAFEPSIRNSPYAQSGRRLLQYANSTSGQQTPTNRQQQPEAEAEAAEAAESAADAASTPVPDADELAAAQRAADADLCDLIARMERIERAQHEEQLQREQQQPETEQQQQQQQPDAEQQRQRRRKQRRLRRQLSRGNSVRSFGWSDRDGDQDAALEDDVEDDDDSRSSDAMSASVDSTESGGGDDQRWSTFSTLVKRHQRDIRDNCGAADPVEVWRRFELSVAGGGGHGLGAETTELVASRAELTASEDDDYDDGGDEGTTLAADEELADFELVADGAADRNAVRFTLPQLKRLVQQASQLALERGIDAQDFRCAGCPTPLGLGSDSAALFCHLTGAYYCADCMSAPPSASASSCLRPPAPAATGPDLPLPSSPSSPPPAACGLPLLQPIPARIVHNWDFAERPVCRMAAAFLREFRRQPFIDMRLLNAEIYAACAQMADLQSQRIQLNFLRAYLANCWATPTTTTTADAGETGSPPPPVAPPPAADAFEPIRRQLSGRHHLHESVHLYTPADLLQLAQLAADLREACRRGRQHVAGCRERCAAKGFVCEWCRDGGRLVYPFDVRTTFRCERCGAVFHRECCLASGGGGGSGRAAEEVGEVEAMAGLVKPCPRCARRRAREERMWQQEQEQERLEQLEQERLELTVAGGTAGDGGQTV